MSEKLRGTGRTTRMLQAAITSVIGGGYAFVIMGHGSHIDYARKILAELDPGGNDAVDKYYTSHGGQIALYSIWERAFDPRDCRVLGAHPSCKVFVDHEAPECLFGLLLNKANEWNTRHTEQVAELDHD